MVTLFRVHCSNYNYIAAFTELDITPQPLTGLNISQATLFRAHLELSSRQEDTGAGDGLGGEAYKDIRPQTVVHEIPAEYKRVHVTHTHTHRHSFLPRLSTRDK